MSRRSARRRPGGARVDPLLRIVLTRPGDENEELAQAIRKEGWEAYRVPCLVEEEVLDAAPDLEERLRDSQAVAITSARAARWLAARLRAWPAGAVARLPPLVAVGAKSASPLRALGLELRLAADPAEGGRGVASELAQILPEGGRVFFPSAETTAGTLESALEERPAAGLAPIALDRCTVYRVVDAGPWELEHVERIEIAHYAVFHSPTAARSFLRHCTPELAARALEGDVTAIAAGATTAAALDALHWRAVRTARAVDCAGIIACIRNHPRIP